MALYLSLREPARLFARAPSGFCHHHKKEEFDLKLKLDCEIRIIPRERLSGKERKPEAAIHFVTGR